MGQPAFLKEGLLAHFPLDGNLDDYSGNQIQMRLIGDANYTNSTILPTKLCLNMVSTNTFLEIPSNEKLNLWNGQGFSVSLWIRSGSLASMSLLEWGSTNYLGTHIGLNEQGTGRILATLGYTSTFPYGEVFLLGARAINNTNTFNHILIDWNALSNRFSLFFNGIHFNSLNNNSDLKASPTLGSIHIGKRIYDPRWPLQYQGDISNIRIYNRSLSYLEVAQIYNLEAPKLTPVIKTQPISQTINQGSDLNLSVDTDEGLNFQWQLNGKNIFGAKSKKLIIEKATLAESGQYRVIAENLFGNKISEEANVLIVEVDSDSDGLSDYEELLAGTNANKADSDGDGLSDFAEVRTHKSNPLTTDTDGDGYSDGIEVARDGNPNNRNVTPTGALAVFPAVDVEFYTLNSVKYQLEVSTDMAVWTAQGGVVVGNGGSQNHLVRASKATQFWRLKVVQ